MAEQEGPRTQEAELVRYCKRCHRKLKAAASMKIGLGRVCAKKERKEAS
jgi:hypothetical protein